MSNGVAFNKNYPIINKSNEYYNRALNLIPSVTQTMAKGPTQYVNGIAPKYLISGKGSHVWDVDGNEYLDYNMGIGPISLGYCYDRVDEAIKEQLNNGITFSLMHPLEVEVAEMIREIIPNAEMIRYSKSGADITSAAVRLARAYTGKDKILCCGYHGWHDWYVSVIARNAGIPEAVKNNTYTFNYNDIEGFLKSLDDNTAAVILEPMVFEKPKNDFLNILADECKKRKILLIFDEMWTGFRLSLGGAQEYFNIKPDLACYSKAIANGMPIGVLTGKADIMRLLDESVFFFNTFGGETLSLAATKATLLEMIEKNVQSDIRETGKILKLGLRELLSKYDINYLKCIGMDARTMLSIETTTIDPLVVKTYIQQEMIKNGILWSGFHNISFSHSKQDIEYTLVVYDEILSELSELIYSNKVMEKIKGNIIEPTFRKTSNFNLKPVSK